MFTPTILNALIWSKAAKFSKNRQIISMVIPKLLVDDLGLTLATNKAIFSLIGAGQIDSASLMMNGTAITQAIEELKEHPNFPLFLHLTLTEGLALSNKCESNDLTNENGQLDKSFFEFLMISILPSMVPSKLRIYKQLRRELGDPGVTDRAANEILDLLLT